MSLLRSLGRRFGDRFHQSSFALFLLPSPSLYLQMEVIVGDFGIVVVPRDAADTDRIMNHSSILRKYKVSLSSPAGISLRYSPSLKLLGAWKSGGAKIAA